LPLYPYRCKECGHRFEKIQKFGAKPEKVCPKCGGALERTLTAPGLNFKGAGWYVNDYAPKSASSSASSGGGTSSDSSPTEKKASPETKIASASGGNSDSVASPAASMPATVSGTTKN